MDIKYFIKSINSLDSSGDTAKALDRLYDRMDELMKSGDWDEIKNYLSLADSLISDLTINIMLGLLTATLPGKSKLYPDRINFYLAVEKELNERTQSLLEGLK